MPETQTQQSLRVEARPVGKVEQVKAKVKELTKKGKEWFKDKWEKVTSKPREVLNDINISVPKTIEDTYLVDTTEKTNTFPKIPEYLKENFRPLEKGESFEGGMPIVKGEDAAKLRKQEEILYGGEGKGNGKWGTVFLSGEKATKIFNQPESILNAYDLAFVKKYGGVAGMPKFIGVVPNGYQMERFHGESLAKLVDGAFDKEANRSKKSSEVWGGILSPVQAQELLNKVAEFHKGTGRVHGDMGHWDDIIIDPEGKIQITDPEWERIGDQNPHGELQSLYDFFKGQGYTDLNLPETIPDDIAAKNLDDFKREVMENLVIDPVFHRIDRYKDQTVEVKISEGDQVLVSEKKLITSTE